MTHGSPGDQPPDQHPPPPRPQDTHLLPNGARVPLPPLHVSCEITADKHWISLDGQPMECLTAVRLLLVYRERLITEVADLKQRLHAAETETSRDDP